MHGAIVADTLRIPWVPVVCSPAIPPFKWIDWTRSLDLDYRPRGLPPSSGWEAIKHRKIRMANPQDYHRRFRDDDIEALIDDFYRRYGDTHAQSMAPRMGSHARGLVRTASRMLDPVMLPRAAAALRAVAKCDGFLSEERVFQSRVARLQDAVGTLRRAIAA